MAARIQDPDLAVFRAALRAGALGPYVYAALLGFRRYDAVSLDAHVRRGFAYSTLERFAHNADVPVARIAELAGIPVRTLARRKKEGNLAPDESDRLARVCRLFALALALFEGDSTGARDWLSRPQRALDGRVPLEFGATDTGAQEVERLIGRLEHGIIV